MKKILWSLLILLALVLGGCGAGGTVNDAATDTGGGNGSTVTALAVTSTIPIDGATGVTASETFSLIFNKGIDVATVVPSSFTVSCGDSISSQSPLAGFSATYDSTNKSVKVSPTAGWPLEQVCVVTAKGGYLKDVDAVALSASASFSFSTATSVGPQPDGSLSLSADKTVLIADGSSTSTLTATLTNVDGVSGPGVGKSVTFNALLGVITTPDANLALPGVQVATGIDGKAIITYKAGSIAGTGGVTASYGAITTSLSISLDPAPPSTLDVAFVQTDLNPTAARSLINSKQTTLYARVKDSNGNLLSGYTVSFVLSDNQSGAILSSTSAVSNASGWAEVMYTAGIVNSTLTDIITVSAGSLSKTLSVKVLPQIVGRVTMTADLSTLPADNNSTSFLTATVLDTNGDAAVGKVVTVSAQLGSILTPDADSVTAGLQVVTDNNGQAKITYKAGATSGTGNVVATTGGLSSTFNIILTLPAPIAAKINLFYKNLATAVPALPTKILTGSGASTAVFAQVLDSANAPVAGTAVTFTFNVGKNLSGATILPATFVTDVNGFATATYKSGTLSGIDDVLTVSVGTVSAMATFQVNPIVTTIDFDKTALFVDASSTDTLTFTLKNQSGQLMAATAFQIVAGGSVNPSVSGGNTLADGTYTLSIDDLAMENSTITVTAGGQSKTIPVYAGATLELTPASANAPADGVTNLTYIANLRDHAGVVLSGLPVQFSGLNKVLLSTGLALTNASGNATVNVRSTIFTPTDATKEVNAQAGALTAAADAVFEAGLAKTIALSVPALANPLSLGGSTTITAVVTDALGNPVKPGTVVTFALDGTIGSVTGQAVTTDTTGTVTVPFQAGMKSGNVTVTATSDTAATATISLTIKPSDAGIIELSAIEPTSKMINIRGSGTTQSATIYFIVKDGAGNPVADGTVVNFTLPIATAASVLAGGEAIATTTLFAAGVSGTTVNGIASVTLRSGMLARTVGVVARVTVGASSISTEARVTIVGGQPDSRHISLATERHNTAGGITFGLQNSITAFLGDRFSNIPIDGTPVSFYSECGTIGDSTGFVLTSVGGQVVAKMTTQNPTTPNLAGVSWDADADGTVDPFEGIGNVGMCTVLAAMPGQEYYDDFNANGVYDAGVDSCSGDQGEPYIDGNDSGAYELGEFFVDSNNNGSWNGPDGNCSSQTMIWDDISVMMSSYPAPLNVTPIYFTIPIGGYQEFNLNLSDIFGNAPVAGTSLKITADGGTLGGTIDYTVPDYAGYGNWYSEDSNGDGVNDIGLDINGDGTLDAGVPIRFWLSADTAADAAAKAVKITVTRSPAPASSAGSDGIIQTRIISGTINTPASWSRMNVSRDAYTVSAGTGTSNVTATLNDALGNPVQGVTVNFNTEPAGPQYGSFVPASGVTDNNGEVSTVYTAGTLVGWVNLKASDAGGNYVGSAVVNIIPAAVSTVNLSLDKITVTTGGVVTASATVLDAYNNPVAADQTVTFTVPTNSTSGSFSAPGTAKTNSFGIATLTYTAGSDLSLATEIDTLRASVGALNGDAPLSVTTPTEAAKKITMSLATSTMIANGTATTTATAYVSDSATAAGKPVQGVEVLFTTTLGTIVASDFTDASGMATATLTAAAVPGSGTVQVSVGALSATADFTLVPGVAATLTNLLAFPATVKPSGTSTISVRVVDANGNVVADGTFVSFAVTTNNSGGSLLSTSATTLSGNASVVYKAGNSLVIVDDTITISSNPAAAVTADVTVDTGESSIDAMTITTSSAILRNNGTDAALITATVTKAGVPVEGIDVSFAKAGVAGTLFTTGGAPYAGAIFTDSNGEAQVVFTSGVVQGTATVTAAFGAINEMAVLTIIDKVAQVVVTSDDATIVANGTSTTNVTATVTDLLGVPLAGIPLNLSTTRGTLSAGPYSTNPSGQVTATLTSTAIVGTALVTANYGAITDTEPVQFVVGPPATVTMTGSPTTLPYGAQTSLTVEVRDAQTRPVPNANLYFGFDTVLPATGNASGGSYSLTSGTSDAQGRLTLNYTSGSVLASDTLLVETEEAGIDATLVIVVNPATAAVGNMVLAAPTSPTIVATGATTTQLTATVTDSLGVAMNGVPVNFATTYGTIDTDGTPQTRTVITNALGKATLTLTSTTTTGAAYVTAVTGGFQGQQRVDFIPGIPVWKNAGGIVVSSLTPTSSALAADNASSTEVKAVLKDAYGNLVADGTSVTLLSTLGTILTNPVTTVNGVATFTVTATRTAGTSTLSLSSVTGLTSAIEFGVNNGANIGVLTLNAVTSNITVAGAGQPASTTITIQAVESDGTPIDEAFWGANNTVRLSLISHPGGGEFVAGTGGVCSNAALLTEGTCVAPATWDAGQYTSTSTGFIDVRTTSGTATVTLQAGTLPGVIEIKATALDETGSTTDVTASLPNITVAAGPVHSIVLIPGTSKVNTTNASLFGRTGTIIATDRFGNAVPDGTELNLGLVDTILAADVGAASTNGSGLTGTFIATPVRAIQANDRVVITNAAAVDRNRFIATGLTSPFTVTQNYNNTVVGGLNAYIGAALQGGYVSGGAGEIGRTTTTNGIATLNVTYPASLTITAPARGYGCGVIPVLNVSEGVFVVVTSNVGGVTTINQGGFCFAP